MTGYNKDDMNGWEFKIVRSNFGTFRNPQAVRKLCEEEAVAGWEMLEKFDDHRIRFKRRVEKRSMGAHLATDPYRTGFGAGSNSLFIIVGTLLLLVAGLAMFLFFVNY